MGDLLSEANFSHSVRDLLYQTLTNSENLVNQRSCKIMTV